MRYLRKKEEEMKKGNQFSNLILILLDTLISESYATSPFSTLVKNSDERVRFTSV